MKHKHFANGFDSWQETHFEIVDFITTTLQNWEEYNSEPCAVYDKYEEFGRGGMFELAKDWTDEFENLNKGRNWEKGDFYEEIEEFCKKKNQ